jgi:hypothetical protein
MMDEAEATLRALGMAENRFILSALIRPAAA